MANEIKESLKFFDRSLSNMVVESITNVGKDKVYRLRGMCADFSGELNENGRYYVPENYLPLVENLQPLIQKNKLVGETEHPKSDEEYDLDLKKELSHIITKLWYDEVKKQVWIEVELLPTQSGKNIMTYVDRGIPISISSRAEGFVGKDGKTILDRIITFDIVWEPGFKDAKLEIICEHLTKKNQLTICREKNNMENNKTPLQILEEKFTNQLQEIKSQVSEMKMTSIKHTKNLAEVKTAINSTQKKISKISKFRKISEGLEKIEILKNSEGKEISFFEDKLSVNDVFSIDGVNYIIREVEDAKEEDNNGTDEPIVYRYKTNDGENDVVFLSNAKGEVFKTDGETVEKEEEKEGITEALESNPIFAKLFAHIDSVTESHNKMVDEVNGQSEKIQGILDYCNHQDEILSSLSDDTESLSDVVNKLVGHIENDIREFINELADQNDQIVDFVNDLADKSDEIVDFNNDLADDADKKTDFVNDIAEYLDKGTEEINPILGKKEEIKENKENILSLTKKFSDKIANIGESVKKQRADREEISIATKYATYDSMGEELKSRFKSLGGDQRSLVNESISKLRFITPEKIEEIFVDAEKSQKNTKFLVGVSESHRKIWESLDPNSKRNIVSLVSLRNINNDAEIETIIEQYNTGGSRISESFNGVNNNQAEDFDGLGYTDADIDRALGL